MDRQGPPNRPRYQLTRGLIGLDNEKDTMTSTCLDRKYARGDTWQMYTLTGPAGSLYRMTFSVIWRDRLRRPVKQLSIG